jgi:UDP-N-acetylmuramoylalanine--D-glutamate ligase
LASSSALASPIASLDGTGIKPETRVLVLGHGREGSSAARFLASAGVTVTVADCSVHAKHALIDDADIQLAPEDPALLDVADSVLVSPGIPDSNVLLAAAVKRGLPVTTATRLFFTNCPCPVIGVTGSNGKSTTASLIAAILQSAGIDVALGGNIGHPMLDLLPNLSERSLAVVELSSFQLQLLDRSPHVAVVTNITPNHLDRHGSFAAYVEAKRHIVFNQKPSDVAVLNCADPRARDFAVSTSARVRWFGHDCRDIPSAHVSDGWLVFDDGHTKKPILPASDVSIPGRHNVENVLAALAATQEMAIDADILRSAIKAFRGLPHRLQHVATHEGITYVNDSIATSPERAGTSIQSIDTPVVLIAGGRSKHLPWTPVLETGAGKVHSVILMGEAADEIEAAIYDAGLSPRLLTYRAGSMVEAVDHARARVHRGDTVLLSPGCTSFDMFKDFEERGRAFTSAVEGLWQR